MVGYGDLIEDLAAEGCPVCRGSVRSAVKYLEHLLWENVNDPGVREVLRRDRGFCREHSLALIQIAGARGEALGVAIVYEDVLGRILDEPPDETRRRNRHRGRRNIGERCRACAVGDEVAVNYLRIIAEAPADSEIGTQVDGGTLCHPHLLRGLEIDGIDHDRLRALFADGAGRVRTELRRLIDHADYRRAGEPFGTEKDAWRRAVHLVIGSPVYGSVAEPRP